MKALFALPPMNASADYTARVATLCLGVAAGLWARALADRLR